MAAVERVRQDEGSLYGQGSLKDYQGARSRQIIQIQIIGHITRPTARSRDYTLDRVQYLKALFMDDDATRHHCHMGHSTVIFTFDICV